MKTIRVVAAVIQAENAEGKPMIFATQRGYGEMKDGWEFPGGKIEKGETPEGDLVLKEHEAARWLTEEELYSVEWLPADISLIEKIKRTLSVSCN